MSFSAIVRTVLAIAEAIPTIAKLIDRLMDAWIDKRIDDIKDQDHERDKQKLALINSIKKAQSDEERIALSSVLAKFNSNEL